eukprot:CAMPEP_0184662564 /NCGR_PEP_ID=MMETSP0308-20130426/43827_1 /TAXON_ID=38269 /ORGANISM="Gloeochaete witrockiana, Strain SAG 46.84" /LENGTH=139 /DNA_ID=CAMNT_0027104679 /DNA_START=146 /DNA_END=565 /DNA_ORIENTATION=+
MHGSRRSESEDHPEEVWKEEEWYPTGPEFNDDNTRTMPNTREEARPSEQSQQPASMPVKRRSESPLDIIINRTGSGYLFGAVLGAGQAAFQTRGGQLDFRMIPRVTWESASGLARFSLLFAVAEVGVRYVVSHQQPSSR